ncbi:hypothetical protein CXG81DRAFT_13128 [Caulochytrium protostelioides]|uniref:TFIID subunit TAF5 NTD2 domain-containing protein n=1 Tax=Caulochytrium protostelioides TaxID=1555241 RepID=A0A4P9X699_9FUNG|nr:hypothetical protein CXG81DRAFT_13128 [Caulochytrium protostelioides]|eukprot:RKP00540.1 hypothetical protein CXG81DRAFT_13128 [Caulochytrium protostelioides]
MSDTKDRIVAQYLRSRGYTAAAETLKLANANHIANEAHVGEFSVEDYILFYNENEAQNAQAYEQSYALFRKWVDDSLEVYRLQMRKVLYPLFVHGYLDMIERGLRSPAHHFFEVFHAAHLEGHQAEVLQLGGVLEPHHIKEHNIAKAFRTNKYRVSMSRFCFELMLAFLQDNGCGLLLRLLNQYFIIRIVVSLPASLQQAPPADDPEIIPPVDGTTADGAADARSGADGKLAASAAEAAEMPTSLLRATLKKAETDPVLAAAVGITAPSQLPMPETRTMVLVEKALKGLRDLAYRMDVSPTNLPSICFYTMHNTAGRCHCHAVTHDATLVASGFADSLIQLWSLPEEGTGAAAAASVGSGSGAHGESDMVRLVGHAGPVYGMDFSSNNRFLLSAGEDAVRLWSTDTHTNVVAYKGHNYPVWDVAFGPGDYYFATASHDRTARLWSCDQIYPLRLFAGHLADVETVRFHPNGNYVLTGSADQTCRLWDIQKGCSMRLLTRHAGAVTTVAFSPDGRTVAAAGEDRAIHLWDLGTGKRIKRFEGHVGSVYSLSFSGNGALLASGGADETVRLWNVKTSETREVGQMPMDPYGGGHGGGHGGGLFSSRPGSASGGMTAMPAADPALLATYPTKRTPVPLVQFTRRNLLLAIGSYRP